MKKVIRVFFAFILMPLIMAAMYLGFHHGDFVGVLVIFVNGLCCGLVSTELHSRMAPIDGIILISDNGESTEINLKTNLEIEEAIGKDELRFVVRRDDGSGGSNSDI